VQSSRAARSLPHPFPSFRYDTKAREPTHARTPTHPTSRFSPPRPLQRRWGAPAAAGDRSPPPRPSSPPRHSPAGAVRPSPLLQSSRPFCFLFSPLALVRACWSALDPVSLRAVLVPGFRPWLASSPRNWGELAREGTGSCRPVLASPAAPRLGNFFCRRKRRLLLGALHGPPCVLKILFRSTYRLHSFPELDLHPRFFTSVSIAPSPLCSLIY
jgi:hypothetical protein